MNDAHQILSELRGVGVRVELDGGQLRCRAPKGVLTPERVHRLTVHKPTIIALLSGNMQAGPVTMVPHRPPLGPTVAACLAAGFTQPEIVAQLARLEADYQVRADDPERAPLFAQLIADWRELLTAKDMAIAKGSV